MTRNWLFLLLLFTVTSMGSGFIHAAMVDPTRPPNITDSHDNTFVLTAILIAPDHRMAVINGKILHIGDQINATKVININDTNVDLESSNGKVTLVLTGSSVAKPVKEYQMTVHE
jgi:hypothetical protein